MGAHSETKKTSGILEKKPEVNFFKNGHAAADFFNKHSLIISIVSAAICLFSLLIPLRLIHNQYLRYTISIVSFIICYADLFMAGLAHSAQKKSLEPELIGLAAALFFYLSGSVSIPLMVVLCYRFIGFINQFAMKRYGIIASKLTERIASEVIVLDGETQKTLPPKAVQIGSIILVNANAIIPLDGTVVLGTSSVEHASAIGDSFRRKQIHEGDNVCAGDRNISGPIRIAVTKEFKDSSAPVILSLLNTADSFDSRFEKVAIKISGFACLLIPVLAIILCLVAGFKTGNWNSALKTAAYLLLSSVLTESVSLLHYAYMCALAVLGSCSIIPRGKDVLDSAAKISTVVFNKTGTITDGEFKIVEFAAVDDSPRAVEILKVVAATVESLSTHPIAEAICTADGGMNLGKHSLSLVEDKPAYGIMGLIDQHEVIAGTAEYLLSHHVFFKTSVQNETLVYVALDGVYLGYISLTEEIRDKAFEAVDSLHSQGVQRVVMITGASDTSSKKAALALNFDMSKTGLDYTEKVHAIRFLEQSCSDDALLLFVGNNETDQLLMKESDLAVAFNAGNFGIENDCSDVLIVSEDISMVAKFVLIARNVYRVSTIICLGMIVGFVLYLLLMLLSIRGIFLLGIPLVFYLIGVILSIRLIK